MSGRHADLQHQIATVVEHAQEDPRRAHDLFNYAWTMVCVQRGLMRVVREIPVSGACQVVVEEIRSGRQRLVVKPLGLEGDVERLAVEAMARILAGPGSGG